MKGKEEGERSKDKRKEEEKWIGLDTGLLAECLLGSRETRA